MNIDNPFGILKVPANASAVEIKSAGQMMVARLRLSDATNAKQIRAVEQAIEQLRDPVARFKYGLEWPSLGPAAAHLLATDPSLLVRSPDIWADRATAIERLVVGESLNSREHIWAVFKLRHAHEVFNRSIASPESSLSDASKHDLREEANSFVTAINQWNCSTREPQFWMAQRMRAKEINDPRVGAELIAACQSDIFSIAIQGFVILASDALRVRNAAVCSAIVDSISASGASRSEIEKALADVYSQLCGAVTGALNGLQEELKTTKSKSPESYLKLLTEYSQGVHPDIALMLAVGDLPGTAEERCRNSAAEFLRSLSVAAANNADAYDVAKEALRMAELVAHSELLRTNLKNDAETLSRLSSQAEHAAQRSELYGRLKAALARRDEPESLQAINQLLSIVSGSDAFQLATLRDEIIADGIVMPITSAPLLDSSNWFGTRIFGDTVYVVLLFAPVWALGRYRVASMAPDHYSFKGRLRLRLWQRAFNGAVVLCVAAGGVVLVLAPQEVTRNIGVVLGVVLGVVVFLLPRFVKR